VVQRKVFTREREVSAQALSVESSISVSPTTSGLFEAGRLQAQIFLPLVTVPWLLLLFPLGCACGGSARGGGSSGARSVAGVRHGQLLGSPGSSGSRGARGDDAMYSMCRRLWRVGSVFGFQISIVRSRGGKFFPLAPKLRTLQPTTFPSTTSSFSSNT